MEPFFYLYAVQGGAATCSGRDELSRASSWFASRSALPAGIKKGSSRDPGKVEVDRQGAGKLAVSKHTTTITLLSP
ncbi:hypothetical protein, partial [Aeromonas sp. QDB25]|uniref:hypothetical protein n=1 Tax=Aeromonas sp. QDB25 TaxID=2989832 RepID=UPI0022E6D3FB